MKKVITALLAGAILLSLSACNLKPKQNEEPAYVQPEPQLDETVYALPENVEAWIVEGSTNATHAVINIVNTSENPITFPVEYRLEKQVDGKWVEFFPKTDVDWDSTLYTVEPNTAKKISIGFMLAYGELEAGTYRILRQVHIPDDKTDYYLNCEFTLQ